MDVGGSTCATISRRCPRKNYNRDLSEQRIATWSSENMPIYEPALNEVVKRGRGKNLFSSMDVQGTIKEETASVQDRSVDPPAQPSS